MGITNMPDDARALPVDLGTTGSASSPYEAGRITGRELQVPGMDEHPNSAWYRVAMQTVYFLAGFRAAAAGFRTYGDFADFQRGLHDELKEQRGRRPAPEEESI